MDVDFLCSALAAHTPSLINADLPSPIGQPALLQANSCVLRQASLP
jgi:hypothetical protein